MTQDPWVSAIEGLAPRARQELGVGPEVSPEELLGEFERQQQRAAEADQRLEQTRFTTTSDDEVVSVTMTGKAQIVSLVIADGAYSRYRPDELGPVVLETLDAASAHCGQLVRESLAGLFGDDGTLDTVMQSWPAGRPAGEDAPRPVADWT